MWKKIKAMVICLYCIFVCNQLMAQETSSGWIVDIAPYAWAINMNGSVGVGAEVLQVQQTFGDILQDIQGAGMLWINAHLDRLGVFANLLYAQLSQNQTISGYTIHATNQFGLFSVGVSYRIYALGALQQANSLALEALAGVRNTLNNTTLKILDLTVKDDQRWTDPLFGLRATYWLTPQWRLIALGDAGGIYGHYSYDFQGYLGYDVQNKWRFDAITAYIGYRALHQHYVNNIDGYFAWNMTIFGPVIGVNFSIA